MDIEESPWI